jgi:hypothetical protein
MRMRMGSKNGGRLLQLAALLLLLLLYVSSSEAEKGRKVLNLPNSPTKFLRLVAGARGLKSEAGKGPGALEARTVNTTIPEYVPVKWADGKSCLWGKDPPDENEVQIFTKAFSKWKKEMTEQNQFPPKLMDHLYSFLGLHLLLQAILNKELKFKALCRSGVCNLDAKKMYFVCGPEYPKHAFADRKSCVDGSEPMTEEEGRQVLLDMTEEERSKGSISVSLTAGVSREYRPLSPEIEAVVSELNKLQFDVEDPSDDEIKKLNKHAQAKYGH